MTYYLSAVVLVFASATAGVMHQGRQERPLGTTRLPQGYTLDVVKTEDGERLRVTSTRHGRSYTLPVPATEIVEAATTRDQSGLILIGRINYANTIDVVDFATGRAVATAIGREPAVSPSGDFVAFKESYRRDETDQPARYRILATGSGQLLGSDGVIYPADGRLHSDQSELYWVNNVLIFLDYVDGKTGAVAVELSRDGRIERIARQDLPTERLVDSSVLEPGADPARFISGAQIREIPGAGLNVRLVFPERAGLKVKRVDLKVW